MNVQIYTFMHMLIIVISYTVKTLSCLNVHRGSYTSFKSPIGKLHYLEALKNIQTFHANDLSLSYFDV